MPQVFSLEVCLDGHHLPPQAALEASPSTSKQRVAAPLPAAGDYGLWPYLTYLLYPPLYLAGPIITFQDFGWQRKRAGTRVSALQVGWLAGVRRCRLGSCDSGLQILAPCLLVEAHFPVTAMS